MSYMELSEAEKTAIRRAEKCFRLAANAGTPAEAATANAMGNEIMLAYNLDMAMLEEHGGDKGKRQDEKLKGGHYDFQRQLWKEVASLNFCMYFNIVEQVKVPKWVKLKPPAIGFRQGFDTKRVRQHRLVGRVVNVRAATVMAQYLEQAIERLTLAEIEERKLHPFCKWAMCFREGIVDAVAEKIAERRRYLVDEEVRVAEAAAAKARAAGMGEVSLSREITIASVRRSEHEANLDFLNPNRHVEKAEQDKYLRELAQRNADSKRRAEERWTKWCAEHPLEAAMEERDAKKRVKEEQKRRERNLRRRTGPRASYASDNYEYGARAAGYDKGKSVSIDRQAGNEKRKALR